MEILLILVYVIGHMEVVWQLLKHGYSPNDTDDLGNTALHLAAASGYKKVVQALIDDGAMPTVVNIYKNPPGHLAKDRDISDMLTLAVERGLTISPLCLNSYNNIPSPHSPYHHHTTGASMTQEDIKRKHIENMKRFAQMETDLSTIVNQAVKMDSPRGAKGIGNINISALIQRLSQTLQVSEEWAVDAKMVEKGRNLLGKLEGTLDLLSDITALRQKMPIASESQYLEFASKLEVSLEKALKIGVDRSHYQLGKDLLEKCQAELHVCSYIDRLKSVECAVDANEHDMKRLQVYAFSLAPSPPSPHIAISI